MFDNLPNIGFDPFLPLTLIAGFALFVIILAAYGGYQKLGSFILRLCALAALCAALLNPQTIIEDREPLSDVVLVLIDQSQSMSVGTRQSQLKEAQNKLTERLNALDNIEIITAAVKPDVSGTRLISSLIDELSDLPRSRLAGVIAITDGQVHDLPDSVTGILPDNIPFHALIIGDPTARDRRIRAIRAAKFGLVDEESDFSVIVDDPGFEGEKALIRVQINGELKGRFPVTIGEEVDLPLIIERRGRNTVELQVEAAPDELTLSNNSFVSEISGIRDRLRVLLVTGEPHRGGRAWRNLLKSDPGVDLVQFTILTNPGVKRTQVRSQNELSLIAFPRDQLFLEKLYEFDLVIFDKFRRRKGASRRGRSASILPEVYLRSVAKYLENGGALLIATGEAFTTDESLYRSPLSAVLPIRPTDELIDGRFVPELTDAGKRHPITAGLQGGQGSWGPWYRLIESEVIGGDTLMSGPAGEPLLIIDRVKDGRVATLMSDQAWLWSKGHEGGGPYNELFRRVAHWLMGEPELEAERLDVQVENDTLKVERFSIRNNVSPVKITAPDGSIETVILEKVGDGYFQATIPSKGQGAYKLNDGDVSTIAAVGRLNPIEFTNLIPDRERLKPLSDASGGGLFALAPGDTLPELSRITIGRSASSPDRLGLVEREQYEVRESRRTPFLPPIVYFCLFILFMAGAWFREGK